VAVGHHGVVTHLAAWPGHRGGPTVPSVWQGAVTVAKGGTVSRAARAHRQIPCAVVDGMGTRTTRGVRRARRMMTRLTEEVDVSEVVERDRRGGIPTVEDGSRRLVVIRRCPYRSRR
jgi:hypothetical protein